MHKHTYIHNQELLHLKFWYILIFNQMCFRQSDVWSQRYIGFARIFTLHHLTVFAPFWLSLHYLTVFAWLWLSLHYFDHLSMILTIYSSVFANIFMLFAYFSPNLPTYASMYNHSHLLFQTSNLDQVHSSHYYKYKPILLLSEFCNIGGVAILQMHFKN